MTYAAKLATARATTKAVKTLLAALLVSVKTDSAIGAIMVNGHDDEILRAEAKLRAAGYVIVRNYGNMLWARAA
jgi:hypothetical protein